jgi:predicted Zn-dependent peptidase
MFQKITLKNGLRIITVPQKNSQAMTVLILVKTGSKYETKEVNGISHFLEHMFFKGTKKRPSKITVAETLDRVGGIYNAFTSGDYTGYYAKVAASDGKLALDWVSDIYLNSLLPEKEIEKEKGVIIEEINMYLDTPMSYIHSLWDNLLYGDQPAGWDVAGTKESVAKISRADLINYRESQYTATNTVCCLVGKINEQEMIKEAKKIFSKINPRKAKDNLPVIEEQTSPKCLLYFKKTDQTHLCLGVRGYNLFQLQRYAQDVLGIILGGMMSSRLFIKIREKLGIAYYVRTYSETNPDTGYLVTQAGIDNKNIETAIKVILKEYKTISQKKISKKELKKAKDYIKGKTSLFLEASDAQASFYALQELLENKILTPEEIFKKIDKVSEYDIMKTARDLFSLEKLNLALIGPFEDKEKFEKLLKL